MTACVWDAATGQQLAQVVHTDSVTGVAFNPDGRLLATASADKTARIWDTATLYELVRVTHTRRVNDVAFNPDGRLLATASADKTARIWALQSDGDGER